MPLLRDSSDPTADSSVRPAVPDDAVAIAGTQLRAWRTEHAEVLGQEVLDLIDAHAVRERWSEAISQAPSPAHHVLVACAGPRVVGVAAVVPTDLGDDGVGVEVAALEVDPDHRRAGHGSRLLAASVDLGRADGAVLVSTWVLEGDEVRERFLAGAGLGPDGAQRVLAARPGREVVERRWVALL
ncbi:GNAT family N-acetyltransferase [Actinotalea sp. M2MS4P-6]|uniref:GNAT family N-acetyltransferase n=1 Tax=Actinotalea sp. M2MS4P-6 TaxID=2983762 RepID=UPI0021E50871|nr:GNAT family N-acetyltransferase [Actinotalea sp. M2MS4P-6]MCV2396132.1 GNAT family N-acetyltransferase [Actinotalea sp. M2MS4P-6]